jgi:creatinine amidohydrolase
MRLAELTWEEARSIGAKTILLPVGSTEQHGYHLPLNNDTFVAERLADHLAAHMNAQGYATLVAPSISVGLSAHHMGFFGTLTLSPSTFQSVVSEVCIGLAQHGLRKVVIVNGHGGNSLALRNVVANLPTTVQARVLEYWHYLAPSVVGEIESSFFCHACEGETSISLALGQLARMDKATCSYPKGDYSAYNLLENAHETRLELPLIHTISASGVIGDSTLADRRKGERILATVIPLLLNTLKESLVT